MSKDFKSSAADLRKRAEELLLDMLPVRTALKSWMSEAEALKMIHEIQVHQVELEMQNEELMRAKDMAEASSRKFAELYDFAPSGYFTLSKEGEIIELNHFGSLMLGKDRQRLKSSRFGFFVSDETKPVFNSFFEKVFVSKVKESCEVSLVSDGNSPLEVRISGIVSENSEGCIVTVVDISELKKLLGLNEVLLSSFPYPAMYIRIKDRLVMAANKKALDLGVKIGGHCWREFLKPGNLSAHDQEIAARYPDVVPVEYDIKCSFCLADKCVADFSEQNNPEVNVSGMIWDTYWIKIDNEIFLHYAINISKQI